MIKAKDMKKGEKYIVELSGSLVRRKKIISDYAMQSMAEQIADIILSEWEEVTIKEMSWNQGKTKTRFTYITDRKLSKEELDKARNVLRGINHKSCKIVLIEP
ncbi:MAG: hypothetical protein IKJ77_00255 [Firmicutes bacterium]|nr:hypothetical protein [Bacillota bacterium]